VPRIGHLFAGLVEVEQVIGRIALDDFKRSWSRHRLAAYGVVSLPGGDVVGC
jgi:hypothetical protein